MSSYDDITLGPNQTYNIINAMTHSDVIIGQVVTSSVKLHQEARFTIYIL